VITLASPFEALQPVLLLFSLIFSSYFVSSHAVELQLVFAPYIFRYLIIEFLLLGRH
jgi:hypothetical protein